MTDKFTPGPWHAVQPNVPEYTGLLIKPIPGDVVAEIDGLPNAQANARLIAAAPELLEACRRLLGWSWWDQGGSAGRDAEFARAAILRATGEKEQEKPE